MTKPKRKEKNTQQILTFGDAWRNIHTQHIVLIEKLELVDDQYFVVIIRDNNDKLIRISKEEFLTNYNPVAVHLDSLWKSYESSGVWKNKSGRVIRTEIIEKNIYIVMLFDNYPIPAMIRKDEFLRNFKRIDE